MAVTSSTLLTRAASEGRMWYPALLSPGLVGRYNPLNMISHRRVLVLFLVAFTVVPASAEDWTRFRGPNGSGIARGEGYPSEFSPEQNVAWKAPVRPGKSSLVLSERHVFLTAFDEGKLFTQCFNRRTGKLAWEQFVERSREADLHQLNEPASVAPVTDGENVYVFFRDVGLISYDAAGNHRWTTALGPFANYMGQSSSPIIADGRIVLQLDQAEGSYVAAFNPRNGEIEWKTPREEGQGWATPLVYEGSSGPQLVTVSRSWIGGHRLDNGKRLWGKQAIPPAIVASPVLNNDTVYTFGYGNEANRRWEPAFLKKDKDGDGVLSQAEHGDHAFMAGLAKYTGNKDGVLTMQEWVSGARETVAPSSMVAFRFGDAAEPRELWRREKAFNYVIPSALIYDDVIYLIKKGGILETLDAETGETLKRGRVREAIEGYTASPVAADGKVYLASEGGKIAVLRAAGQWEITNVNDLGEEIFATPALSDGKLFVRTAKHLYAYGN